MSQPNNDEFNEDLFDDLENDPMDEMDDLNDLDSSSLEDDMEEMDSEEDFSENLDEDSAKGKKGKKKKKKKEKKPKKTKAKKERRPSKSISERLKEMPPLTTVDYIMLAISGLVLLAVIVINLYALIAYGFGSWFFLLIFDILGIALAAVPLLLWTARESLNFFDVALGVSLAAIIISSMMVLLEISRYGGDIKAKNLSHRPVEQLQVDPPTRFIG